MRRDTHPDHHPVVFRDRSGGTALLTRSTAVPRTPGAVVQWEDGRTYPVVDVDVSSASHPSWTGRARVLDAEGRVERSNRRYGRTRTARPAAAGPAEGPAGTDR